MAASYTKKMRLRNEKGTGELCLRLHRSYVIGFSALTLLAFGPAAKANLITNGSFETTSLTTSGLFYPGSESGTTAPSVETGWTVDCAAAAAGSCVGTTPILTVVFPGTATTNYGYENQALYGPTPTTPIPNSPDGGNFVAGNGDPAYNVPFSQSVTGLIPGDIYTLTFYQAGAQEQGKSGATTEYWQVTFGSQVEDSATMNTPSMGFTPWSLQTLTFTATAATQVLQFLSIGTPGGAPPTALLDGVSLTPPGTPPPPPPATPEPSGLALLGFGTAWLVAVRGFRRRRI